MDYPTSLLILPPEWNQAPKLLFLAFHFLHDHLETAVFQDSNKLVKSRRV